jgi:SAM-dependent methyltransferase
MKNVYLGAGSDRKEGFLHLDAYPFEGSIVWKCPDRLPFEDSSVDYLFSQDFFEHIEPKDKIPLINEIWRVLKPEGIMEHIIPLAGSRNDFGSPSHLSHWHPQQFEHFDVDSYRYAKDHVYEGFVGGFKKVESTVAEDGQTFHVIYSAVK